MMFDFMVVCFSLLRTASAKLKHSNSMASRRKTVLCRHFTNGTCRKGSSCTFAHGDEELAKRSG